uniref:Ubiquitin-like domain-containing protein n=1 Tax=Leptobrachium leishanense TaxID=445787 RepID=A0A8C5WJ16_9ANUR
MEADGQNSQPASTEGDVCSQASDGASSPVVAAAAAADSVSNRRDSESNQELVEVKIIWNENKYDLKLPLDSTVASIKQKIHSLTGTRPMQKVMFKGLVPEDKTLWEIKVTNGAKVMGSTINDVLAVTTLKETIQQEVKEEENKKEPLCRQKVATVHRKVLDKGKPEDVMPSLKGERLPTTPISGMYNKSGITRHIQTFSASFSIAERTKKIPMGSIMNVITEPIEDHDDYHMMAFQLGPTEASYYWVYWVPAQYVDAIKDTVYF